MDETALETARLEALDQPIDSVSARAQAKRDFRRAIGPMGENLQYVREALGKDPNSWRLNRAFHAVHVPSFLAIMTLLDSVDGMASVSEADRHQINVSLHRAAQLAQTARDKLEQANLTETRIELDVLAETAPPPETPFRKPSFLTRTLDGVAAVTDASLNSVKSGAASGANTVTGLAAGVVSGVAGSVDRVPALGSLAANLQKSLSGALSDAITKPLAMRIGAGTQALKHATGAGVGLGMVIAVLCPPLLPLSAAGAVLAAARA